MQINIKMSLNFYLYFCLTYFRSLSANVVAVDLISFCSV